MFFFFFLWVKKPGTPMSLVMMEQWWTCFWKLMLHQQWQTKVIFLTMYSRWWQTPSQTHQRSRHLQSARLSFLLYAWLIQLLWQFTLTHTVISCHINTYISGSYYKACNSGAPLDSWQCVIGCIENVTYVNINPRNARNRLQGLFYYICTGSFVNFWHFLLS